ncbi:MAG: methyltransferase domain-containing protein [Chthoniobacterales bacterium]|jgi:spermidine synthase
MRRTGTLQTDHQSLEIWKSAEATEFRVAGAVHAFHHKRRFLTGLAWDMIAAAALLGEKTKPSSVLMLGLAGGTSLRVLRHLVPDARFTAIDIDEQIVMLARQHMELDALGIDVIIGDAYRWLEKNRQTFDVVIDDIYLAGKTDVFRPHTWDTRLMQCLRRAIAPGGILAANLLTGRGHRAMQSSVRQKLKSEFPVVRSVRSPLAMNEVLVAGQEVAPRGRLGGFTTDFTHRGDRAQWRKITVERIC